MKQKSGAQITQIAKSSKIQSGNLIPWVLVLFIAVLPLIFNPIGYNMFPLVKLYLFYVVALITFVVYIRQTMFNNRLDIPRSGVFPILFLVLLGISATFSIHPKTAFFGEFTRFEGLLTWVCYLWLGYISYAYLADEKWRERILYTCSASLLLVSLYGIAQYFGLDAMRWQIPWQDASFQTTRVHSTIGNPSTLGGYLLLVIPLAFVLAYQSTLIKLYRTTSFAGLALTLGLITLLLTFSRGAWVGLVAVLFLAVTAALFIALRNRISKRQGLAIITGFILIIFFTTSAVLIVPSIKDRMLSIFDISKGSSAGRILLWKQAVNMAAERPLFGWGADTFQLAFSKHVIDNWDNDSSKLDSAERAYIAKSILITDNAHNIFLHYVMTFGMIPFLILLYMVTRHFLIMGQYIKRSYAIKSNVFGIPKQTNSHFGDVQFVCALAAGMLGYVVSLQFHFSTIHVTPIFWILFGMSSRIIDDSHLSLSPKNWTIDVSPLIPKGNLRIAINAFWIGLALILSITMLFPVISDIKMRSGLDDLNKGNIKQFLEAFDTAQAYHPWEEEYSITKFHNLTFIVEDSKDKAMLDIAERALVKAKSLNPVDNNLYFYQADFYFVKGELTNNLESFQKASQIYERIVDLDPNYAQGLLRLGACYYSLERYEKAIQTWKDAERTAPDLPSPLFNIACAYEKLGQLDYSIDYYKKVLEIDKDNKQASKRLMILLAHP